MARAEAKPLRLVVMGTSPFTVPSLEWLAGSGHEVAAVYTQPPRPAGRGHKLTPSAVHAAAERLGLPVRTPARLKAPEDQVAFRELEADLAIVGAYGLLLPPPILAAPRLGCVNLHASLLPRWRGAAPIQRAILAGDAESGVTLFQMEAGLDTGPVLMREAVAIGPATTAASLHEELSLLARDMLPGLLDGLIQGTLPAVPQPEAGITYARKLSREESTLDFTQPAALIERSLRALNPWPGCFTTHAGERLRLIAGTVVEGSGPPGTVIGAPLVIACGNRALDVRTAQRAGRAPMPAEALQRGFPIPVGARLG